MCPAPPAGGSLARPPLLSCLSFLPFAHTGAEGRKADLLLEQAHNRGLSGPVILPETPPWVRVWRWD